jgi:hypothetical protein
MPVRAYRCESGHIHERQEAMDAPRMEYCIHPIKEWGDVKQLCGELVTPYIQPTGTPVIR